MKITVFLALLGVSVTHAGVFGGTVGVSSESLDFHGHSDVIGDTVNTIESHSDVAALPIVESVAPVGIDLPEAPVAVAQPAGVVTGNSAISLGGHVDLGGVVQQHIHFIKKIGVPVAQPYPVPVERHVPVSVPHPVDIPVEVPYPVPVPVQVPIKVIQNVPVPIEKPVPFPVKIKLNIPVKVPYKVYHPQPVPVPVVKKVPVPVPQPVIFKRPVPVAVRTHLEALHTHIDLTDAHHHNRWH